MPCIFLFPFPFRSRKSTRRAAARERRWTRQSERLSLWIWIRNKFEARPRGEPRAAPKKPIGQSLASRSRAFPPWPPPDHLSPPGAERREWGVGQFLPGRAEERNDTRSRRNRVPTSTRLLHCAYKSRHKTRVHRGQILSLCNARIEGRSECVSRLLVSLDRAARAISFHHDRFHPRTSSFFPYLGSDVYRSSTLSRKRERYI